MEGKIHVLFLCLKKKKSLPLISTQSVMDWGSGFPFLATCVAFSKASCMDLTDSLKQKKSSRIRHLFYSDPHAYVGLLTSGNYTQSDSEG